jgi:hypothetical protein
MRAWLTVAAIGAAIGAAGCGRSVRGGDLGSAGGAHDLALMMQPPVEDLAYTPPPDQPPPVGACLGGHYVGTFKGQILLANLFPIDTHGTVDLTLMQTGGEFFEIMNGHLMGMASKNPYMSDLQGTLNCTTLKLENGLIKNGSVTVTGITYMFEGPLAADYDPKTTSFVNGTWNIKQIPMPSSSGMGTWTAQHM